MMHYFSGLIGSNLLEVVGADLLQPHAILLRIISPHGHCLVRTGRLMQATELACAGIH